MKKYPVVILHGWNLNADRFRNLGDKFRRNGFRVYCFDLPGFGKSKIPDRPFYLSDYIDFVVDRLRQKKIKQCILIGHSFGGRIGIGLAAEYPGMVSALILTGAPGLNPVSGFKIFFFLMIAKIGHLLFNLPVISNFTDRARKLLYRTARATDFYNTDANLRETFKNVVREDLVSGMRKIKCPTLLLWGENDGIVPLSVGEKMSEIILGSKIVSIKNARHAVPWTFPQEFAEEVYKFLKEI